MSDTISNPLNQLYNSQQTVFISYARADGKTLAEHLRQKIIELGYHAWQDLYEMAPGKGWELQLKEAIESSRVFALVLTPGALKSEVVREEWEMARHKGIKIIPITQEQDIFKTAPRWIHRNHTLILDTSFTEPVPNALKRALEEPHSLRPVPFVAPPVLPLIAREQYLQDLKSYLLDETGYNPQFRVVSLLGAAGFGKTSLAHMLCLDSQIVDAFSDGLLWATFGQEATGILGQLTEMVSALRGQPMAFHDEAAAARALRQELSKRDCLMVLDDVWNASQINPFLGSDRCAYIITTRVREGIPTIPGNKIIPVWQVTTQEAIRILRQGLQEVSPHENELLKRLAKRLGEWPILLNLVREDLYRRVSQDNQSLENTIQFVNQGLDELKYEAFDRNNESQRNASLAKTIQYSLKRFDEAARQRLHELTIFREDAAIPEQIALRLWSVTAPNLNTFNAIRLLDQFAGQFFDFTDRKLRFHDVLRTYLREQLGGEHQRSLHQALLDSYNPSNNPWHTIREDDGYLYANLTYHLEAAGDKEAIWQLFTSPDWMRVHRLDTLRYQTYLQDLREAQRIFKSWQIDDVPQAVALSFIENRLRSVFMDVPQDLLKLLVVLNADLNQDILPLAQPRLERNAQLESLSAVYGQLEKLGRESEARDVVRRMLDVYRDAEITDFKEDRTDKLRWAREIGVAAAHLNIFDQEVFDTLTVFRYWPNRQEHDVTLSLYSYAREIVGSDYHYHRTKYFEGADLLIREVIKDNSHWTEEQKAGFEAECLTWLAKNSARAHDYDVVENLAERVEKLHQSSAKIWAEYLDATSPMPTGDNSSLLRRQYICQQIVQRGLEHEVLKEVSTYDRATIQQLLESISQEGRINRDDMLKQEQAIVERRESESLMWRLKTLLSRRLSVAITAHQFDKAGDCLDLLMPILQKHTWHRTTEDLLSMPLRQLLETAAYRQTYTDNSSWKSSFNYREFLLLATLGRFDLLERLTSDNSLYLNGNHFRTTLNFWRTLQAIKEPEDVLAVDNDRVYFSGSISVLEFTCRYAAFYFARQGQLDEAQRIVTLWEEKEKEAHWEKREKIHEAIAQGLVISAGPETAAAYAYQHLANELRYSYEAHTFTAGNAALYLVGVEHAEAFLISDEAKKKGYVEWKGHPGWDELVFNLCMVWSSKLDPHEMAEKLREYKTLRLAGDGTVAQLAQQLVWLDEPYARELLLNYLPNMIPEPQIESDLRKSWVPQREADSDETRQERIQEIERLIGEPVSEVVANRINGYMDFLRYGAPSLLKEGISEKMLFLTHHGSIWSIIVAGQLELNSQVPETTLREIVQVLERLEQHCNQQPDLDILDIWRIYLSMCLGEAYVYPSLYHDLLNYLESNAAELLPAFSLSDIVPLITELAGDGRVKQAELLAQQYLDTIATVYMEADTEERWQLGDYEPERLRAILGAYLCMTAPPIPRRQHILETWVLPYPSLMLLIQLYAYFAAYHIDEGMQALVFTAFSELAIKVDLSPINDKPVSDQTDSWGLFDTMTDVIPDESSEEYDEYTDTSEISEEAELTVDFEESGFELICACLIRDGHIQVVERLISAFDDQNGTFDDLREMIRLGADSLEGMLKVKQAIDKWPSKLNFERWPHSILLDAAKNCHTWSDIEALYNATRFTVDQGLLEALETVVQHFPDDALTAAMKSLVNVTDAMSSPLARSILMAYVLQTASSRNLELTPSAEKTTEYLFAILEDFKTARQYDWGVPWIDWRPASASMLPPLIAYAIAMFVLARCLNSAFPEAHERAQHHAFDALYEELNEVERWDRSRYDQWQGPLRELLNVVGGDKLVKRVIERFDEINSGWTSNTIGANEV